MHLFKISNQTHKPACYCETVQERFDNDDWLKDALAENLDLVRNIRTVIPNKGKRVLRQQELGDFDRKLITQAALNLINALEDYMGYEAASD